MKARTAVTCRSSMAVIQVVKIVAGFSFAFVTRHPSQRIPGKEESTCADALAAKQVGGRMVRPGKEHQHGEQGASILQSSAAPVDQRTPSPPTFLSKTPLLQLHVLLRETGLVQKEKMTAVVWDRFMRRF
jgi:hypothetical protein